MKEKKLSLTSMWPEFDTLWREEFCYDPLLPSTWQEQEPYRLFAENVYSRLVSKKAIQKLLDDAYDDGYKRGKHDWSEEI